MALNERAVRILLDTYWPSAGWKMNPETPAIDFAYAKTQDVMFDPISMSHDQVVDAVLRAISATSKSRVVENFVASLSSRQLDLRSALGSYAVGRHLQQHDFVRSQSRAPCAHCGDYDNSEQIDLNVLNFERIKWGGVRHLHPQYIALDLQLSERIERPELRDYDFAILRLILDVAGSMPAQARPNQLDKALAKIFPSNSAERRTLIAILGFTGVLVDPSRPDFRKQFVPVEERERTPWHTDDWPYPVQLWTGAHGVNQTAVDEWFAEL
jgi:hypothetical protein